MGMCELFGSGPDEVDMGTFLENETSGLDGITQALYTGNATGLHAATVHEESIELDATIGCQEASTACVEGRVIFHHGDGGLDCVDCSAPLRKHSEAGLKGFANTGFMGGCGIVRNGPCSAMNDQNGFVRGSSHPVMVFD